MFSYRKPNSGPSTKSFVIFGHILVLKVSLKCRNQATSIPVKAYAERERSKLAVLLAILNIRWTQTSCLHFLSSFIEP